MAEPEFTVTEIARETVEFRSAHWYLTVRGPNDDWGRHRDAMLNWGGHGVVDWHEAMEFQNLLAAAIARAKQLEQDHVCGTVR